MKSLSKKTWRLEMRLALEMAKDFLSARRLSLEKPYGLEKQFKASVFQFSETMSVYMFVFIVFTPW